MLLGNHNSPDRLMRRYATPGTPAAFGDANFAQLLAAYNNRQPIIKGMPGSAGEGASEYYTPDAAVLNGYAIQPFGGYDSQGTYNNPNMFAVYKDLPEGTSPEALNGTPFDIYTNTGQRVGTHEWQNISGETGLDKIWNTAIPLLTSMFIGGGLAGAAGYGPMAGGGASPGAVGSGAGFVGEGAASGIPGWDAALAGSPSWTSAGGMTAGAGSANGMWDMTGSAGSAGGGVVPPNPYVGAGGAAATGGAGAGGAAGGGVVPPNPYAATGALGGLQNILNGNGSLNNWLGLGSTLLGALSGGQGQQDNASVTKQLPQFLQTPVAGDLIPKTQAMLGATLPSAQSAGSQLLTQGQGLLGQTAPTTPTNPYLSSVADDMQRRTAELLAQNNLDIKGNAIMGGGLGGTRQGVAQGVAAGRAADYLQGNLANLYGGAYNADQNRLRQDWTIGSGLVNQGTNLPYVPLQNTANIYSNFTGFGTSNQNSSSGGGWQGAVGGAMAGAALGRQLGWW